METEALTERGTDRLVSLDAFRGATIVAMILVNNPGTWSAVYPPLLHAEWHGWTPTDLVFPFFLVIVGVAIPLAFERALARGMARRELVLKAARRSAILFALGLAMAAFPFLTTEPELGVRAGAWEQLRIPGVLQRIALCYLAAALLYLFARPRVWHAVTATLLVGYWGLMTRVPVPGFGAARLDDPEGNLAAWVDRRVLGEAHLWVGADRRWDPEGLLSTLPAIATTLLGMAAGRLLLDPQRSRPEKARRLAALGAMLLVAGALWGLAFPINKALWTSSYATFTAGAGLLTLGLFYWLADVRDHRRWARPFVIYGVNAITVFVASGLLAKSLYLAQVPAPDGGTMSLQAWFFATFFLPLARPVDASLLYALVWVTGWFAVLWTMHRRGLVLKV